MSLPTFAIMNLQSADYRVAHNTPAPAPIDCADLHRLARADHDDYRAALTALTPEQLLRQAVYYAAYASERTGLDVTTADALESFLRAVARHHAAQTAMDVDSECGF
jgi:hypothetical protein